MPVAVATYGSPAYGVISPVFAGVMTSLPEAVWQSPSVPVVALTALVNLFVPGALLVALVLAAATLRPDAPVVADPPEPRGA